MSTTITDFKHQYVASSGTGYTMTNAVQVDDVIAVFVGKHASAVNDSVADDLGNTYSLVDSVNLGGSTGNICLLATQVTTGHTGTPTITMTSGGGSDHGMDIFVLRGLSSATADDSGGNTGTGNPLTVSLNPSVTCSLITYYLNEGGDDFTSWTTGLSPQNEDTGHADASGYQLDVAAGSYTPGCNNTGSPGNMVLVAYFPVAGGGGSTSCAWLSA